MTNSLTPVSQEVLEPFTRQDADKVERRAVSLYEQAQKTSVQFAAELYRLQEGSAHLIRGYSNFGEYVEHLFEGVSSVNAYAIVRQGKVLVILEQNGRISLAGKGENLPGTTGVRALAKILKDLGEEAMLAIYDEAAKSDRKVIEDTVLAATQKLIAPKLHELGEGSEEPEEDEEDEEDEEEATLTEDQESLLDSLSDCLHEVRFALLENRDGRKYIAEITEKMPELEGLFGKGES